VPPATWPAARFATAVATGVSSSTDEALAIPNYSADDTVDDLIVHVELDTGACPSGQFGFRTSDVTVVSGALFDVETNEPFFFIVP
jgi:hypothetical protein